MLRITNLNTVCRHFFGIRLQVRIFLAEDCNFSCIFASNLLNASEYGVVNYHRLRGFRICKSAG